MGSKKKKESLDNRNPKKLNGPIKDRMYIFIEPHDYMRSDWDLLPSVYSISMGIYGKDLIEAGLGGLNDDFSLIEYKGEPVCCFNADTDEIIPAKGALEKFEIYVCPLCRQMTEENYTTLIVGPVGCTHEPCSVCLDSEMED